MKSDQIDADLERRFRETLQEVMPQLEPIVGRQFLWDEDDPAAEADDEAAFVAALPFSHRAETAFPRRPFAMLIAASLVAVAGVGAALALTVGRSEDLDAPTAIIAPTTTVARQVESANGSLLTTLVPSGTQPLMVVDRPGWAMSAYAGPSPAYQAGPSATCAGCGVTRLIVAADGPLLAGPVFTAWTLDDSYDITEFDSPVTIGSTEGRFIGSPDGSVPATANRVRVVWPIGPGRTAFVDASGFTNEQVFAMAATLTFESTVPTMPNPPAGFSVVATPEGARLTTQIYNQFTRNTPDLTGYGTPEIELIVTDGGPQGLLDWRNPGGLFGTWGEPHQIDGVTVLVDRGTPDRPEPPIITISATWVVDDWVYTAIGHVFDTETDFLDAVASLRLTDAATFASNATPVDTGTFGPLVPDTDGTGGVFTPTG